MKKTAIASDGSGLVLKEFVKKALVEAGYEVDDVGQQVDGPAVNHIQAARNLAKIMREKKLEKVVIVCGTGAGVSICMNKFKGVYCVACESMFTAPKIALINNANALAMGARVVGPENGAEMALAFLKQGFGEGFAPARRQGVENLYAEMVKLEEELL